MGLAIGDAAPDFTLPDQDGKPLTLSSLQGRTGQKASAGEPPLPVHPGETQHRAGVRHQHRASHQPPTPPAREGPIDPQPGWGRLQGHLSQLDPGTGRQNQIRRYRTYGRPAEQKSGCNTGRNAVLVSGTGRWYRQQRSGSPPLPF